LGWFLLLLLEDVCQIVVCQVNLACDVGNPLILLSGITKLANKTPEASPSFITNPALVRILLEIYGQFWLVVIAEGTKEQMFCAFRDVRTQHR
tara:strand:- start:2688 stop:2966 length:279 start_codon:yes stop_codon:yes gene_type:complete